MREGRPSFPLLWSGSWKLRTGNAFWSYNLLLGLEHWNDFSIFLCMHMLEWLTSSKQDWEIVRMVPITVIQLDLRKLGKSYWTLASILCMLFPSSNDITAGCLPVLQMPPMKWGRGKGNMLSCMNFFKCSSQSNPGSVSVSRICPLSTLFKQSWLIVAKLLVFKIFNFILILWNNSIGFGISLPHRQIPNPWYSPYYYNNIVLPKQTISLFLAFFVLLCDKFSF